MTEILDGRWLRNTKVFSGFAGEYDAFRPSPPPILLELLPAIAGVSRPRLVVDLGSGTGLSTRFWAEAADEVVGVEPNPDMRRQAEAATAARNVRYRDASSGATGLPDASADIVTAAQALHWMEPASTLREIVRILRPSGVFAAFDYDLPPTTAAWEVDAAFRDCQRAIADARERLRDESHGSMLRKEDHLGRMRDCGLFRFVNEVTVHETSRGTADQLLGLLLTQGNAQDLMRLGETEESLGLAAFADVSRRLIGEERRTWYWSYRVRFAVK
jgi:SAM-dependent methyltransferase